MPSPANDPLVARANTLYQAQGERALDFQERTAVAKDIRDNSKKVSN